MKKLSIPLLMFCVAGCTSVTNEQVGSVAGGVVGGLLGSQIGGGSGKVIGAASGAFLGTVLGAQIGKYMDKVDRMQMQSAFENTPTGEYKSWKNPDTGNRYQVQPTRTYYKGDQPCREYVANAQIGGKNEKVVGQACRQADGSWRIVS
jgi:surface antigen